MTKNNQKVGSENVNNKKVVKRGLSTAKGTTRLKFTHELAHTNGLFIGHLEDVKLTTITIGEEKTGMPSFNGCEIPKLTLTFCSNEADANKRRYVTLSFTAQESNVNTIPGGKEEWKVNSIFDWLKHILNVYYLRGRELSDEESTALSLSFEDFDDQGEYVPVDTQEVIDGWKLLFENFVNIMNRGKNDSPVYYTKDNKPISVWLKLIRFTKTKKGWQPVNNGDLSFPSFVGEGCIEIFTQNTPPSIRIDSIKETILPMNVEKPKTPNMPNNIMGGAPVMGGVPIMNGMNNGVNTAGIASEAAEDLPF